MIRSGIAPLDARLGGLVPGRIHLVAGGVGTGKTTACLHFIAAGLESEGSAALLTLDRPAELAAHANFLGIELEPHLRAGRLRLLRFRSEFVSRLAHAPSAAVVAEDLRTELCGSSPPTRVAIDPVSPFLGDGSPAGAALAAVVALLEELGCTALLTYPGPVRAGTDRRLDPMVDGAALVAELSREPGGDRVIHVARARLTGAPPAPILFGIEAGAGMVEPDVAPRPSRRAAAIAVSRSMSSA